MRTLGSALIVKYGLGTEPSDYQITRWVELTEKYINFGYAHEESGRKAASEVFPDFNKYFYRSEADTIYALLQAAKRK